MSDEIQWRRRWHPDLKACPWQSLNIDEKYFLIKKKFSNDSCEILLTDLVSFWYEQLSETALKKRVQKLNPSVEAPVTKILDHIKGNLEKPSRGTTLATVFKPDGDGERILFKIDSELAGMPFSWNFNCKPIGCSVACDHLTTPMMAMVAELSRRQQDLVKIILAKDKEIDDYKSQGVRTSRKHIETVPFDETAFKNSMVVSKGFKEQVRKFGSAAFNEDSQELYRQIMTTRAWLNRSPTKDEISDSLDDDESLNAGVNSGSSIPSWANRLPPSIVSSKETSPKKSPSKSPASSGSRTPDGSPVKNVELVRRQALERRLEQEDVKKQEKTKKKKKICF